MEFADLLEFLSNRAEAAVAPEDVGLYLQSHRDRFVNLLAYKGPDPEARKQVESLLVVTPRHGEQRLDPEPDKRLALLLSNELKLNELLCVDFLIIAAEERGQFNAEAAAGVYFEERQAAAKCLMRLAAEVAHGVYSPDDQARHPYGSVLHDFLAGILAERGAPPVSGQKGPQLVLSRLVDLLKDSSLEPAPSSALPEVRDEAGFPVSRLLLLQLERRLLVKALLYCLVVDQRAAPSVVVSMLELLTALTAKAKGSGGQGGTLLTEAIQLLLLAVTLALTPHEERGAQEREELVALAGNAAVREKLFPPGSPAPGTASNLGTSPAPSGNLLTAGPSSTAQQQQAAVDGPTAVLRLCWGILLASVGSTAAQQEEAAKLLSEASATAVFSYLKQVFLTPHFKQDDSLHQELVACCMYRLFGQALQADGKLEGPMSRALLDRSMLVVKRSGGGALSFSPVPADDPAFKADHVGSQLAVLSAIFKYHPSLWLGADAGYAGGESQRHIEALISRTVMHDAMKVSPEVRVPFLDMMSSLACGEYGASLVLRQFNEMGRRPALEVLSWRRLFTAIVEYCVRYSQIYAEAARAGGGVPGMLNLRNIDERVMNSYEAEILVAFLGLFRQVVEQGALADVRAWLEGLERELGPQLNGYPLTEPMFQLMCYPVPNTVKAVLDECLAAIAQRFRQTTGPRLLERLYQCAAIVPGVANMPGVPRLDLVTQLNEIEARKEEYPETIAFIRLLNSLITSALLKEGPVVTRPVGAAAVGQAAVPGLGAGGVPAAGAALDGGVELGLFTGFVVQHVLAHAWQRGYRYPAQRWEVAAMCFQHLELMMELAARSSLPAGSPDTRQPPGWMVMHDVLGGGHTMQALLHTLSAGYERISALRTAAANAAASVGPPAGLMSGGLFSGQPGPAGLSSSTVDEVAACEAATVAALRVINKVLSLDARFLADMQATMGSSSRYQPLDVHLRAASMAVPGSSMGSELIVPGAVAGSQRWLLGTLLEYVCYQEHEEIQVESLKLALELSARLPNLVELLQQQQSTPFIALPGPGTPDSRGTVGALRRGYAIVLRQSIFKASAVDNLEARRAGEAPAAEGAPDERAALVLRLLLQNVDAPAVPSVTHLLMGYDVEPGMNAIEDSILLPRQEYSCLTIIERALLHSGCSLSRTKPKLYSQMLCLLYRLAAHPVSSVPMLEYLAPKNQDLLARLRTVLSQELPGQEATLECAAALHQLSWLMRLQSLLLLRLEHEQSAHALLADLFAPETAAGPDGLQAALMPVGHCIVLQVLRRIAGLAPKEAGLGDIPAEERRLQADMVVGDVSIEALLVQPHVQAALGLHMRSDTGDVLFDMSALYPQLMQRYEQYVARTGQSSLGNNEAPAAAVRSALLYVQQYNAHALLSGAQTAAAEAWMQLVEVSSTRQYEQLGPALPGTSPAEKLLEVLMASLETTRRLVLSPASASTAGPSVTLPPLLVNVARILLSKLQEQGVVNVSMGQAADPLAMVRVPGRCQALLRLLLDLLLRVRRTQAVRLQLYAALLQYLQFCRGSKLSSCPPIVLSAILQGWAGSPVAALTDGSSQHMNGYTNGSGAASHSQLLSRLDANQEAIESGNALLVNEQGPALVEVIARDALDASSSQLQQAISLHLLAALLSAGSQSPTTAAVGSTLGGTLPGAATGAGSTVVAAALYQHNVPQAILQGLASVPDALLAAPSRTSRRAVFVLEAQLSLLLALAQAGPVLKARQLSAQALYALQPLQFLAGCRALDLEPEDPSLQRGLGGGGGLQQLDSLRYRLQHLICPSLRLVLSLTSSLPESNAVMQDTRLLVGAHYRMLDRVLREAAAGSSRDWSPGDPELEQAELATCLLSRLVPVWQDLGPAHGEGLRHALFRLILTFGCMDTKSGSPIVRSLHAEGGGTAGGNRSALIGRASRVAGLRAALARFLRDLVAAAPSMAASSTSSSSTTGVSAPAGIPAASTVAAVAATGVSVTGADDARSAPLRLLGPAPRLDYDPHTGRPTLLLVRDFSEQACLDAGAALDELQDLLALLSAPDTQLDDRTCAERLSEYGPAGGLASLAAAASSSAAAAGEASSSNGGSAADGLLLGAGGLAARRRLARHYLAMAASKLDALLGKTLYILENCLAIVVLHFIRFLPRPFPSLGSPVVDLDGSAGGGGFEELMLLEATTTSGAKEGLGGAAAGKTKGCPEALGSQQDLAFFVSRLQETCLKAEDLLGKVSQLQAPAAALPSTAGAPDALGQLAGGRHADRLHGVDLMVRTLKSYCATVG